MRMRWLYERQVYESAFNGPIVVTRCFGRYAVSIHGIDYFSRHLDELWRAVFAESAATMRPPVREVLMCGLCAGQQIVPLIEAFPGCAITAVEIDPAAIRIARDLKTIPDRGVRLIEGDATTVVFDDSRAYDLVIIDLFDSTAQRSTVEETTARLLRRVSGAMAPAGLVLINMTNKPTEFLRGIEGFRAYAERRFRFNTIVSLRK